MIYEEQKRDVAAADRGLAPPPMNEEQIWLVVGLLGQALFSARFLVQWIASERARRSVIPLAFWTLSLGGGATLLSYAIYRRIRCSLSARRQG